MRPIPRTKPYADLLQDFPGNRLSEILGSGIGPTQNGRYLHWEEIRRRPPPKGLTSEEWWLGTKIARSYLRRELPVLDAFRRPFSYALVDPLQELLHQIDQKAAGQITIDAEVTNRETRDRYIVNSLIEEAITSSQLEGAATTREVAADMIRSGRRPQDRSERMIVNNYLGVNFVRTLVGKQLEPDDVLDLHRKLTEDTLDEPEMAGRLQRPGDKRVHVADNRTNAILYEPPPAEELPDRLQRMCDFANKKLDGEHFVHPIIRAVTLHFWLAIDHPFVDGNGRTARALFYWSMLTDGYWLFEYVSISTILKNAFAKYARSYLYAESDENDATYFVLFQLSVIVQAIEKLEGYLQGKIAQVRAVERTLRSKYDLNHRQLALLSHALRHPNAEYTIASHKRSHKVAYATARADLLNLAEDGLLAQRRLGAKTHVFSVPNDLHEIVAKDT